MTRPSPCACPSCRVDSTWLKVLGSVSRCRHFFLRCFCCNHRYVIVDIVVISLLSLLSLTCYCEHPGWNISDILADTIISGWWLAYPSEKWWSWEVLGWWHSQLFLESHKIPWFQTTNLTYVFFSELAGQMRGECIAVIPMVSHDRDDTSWQIAR